MQAKNTSLARREHVERGIYRKPGTRRYEINYTDSNGRQRWKTVDGGVKEARTIRADIIAKLGKGERVVPTSMTFEEYATEWVATVSVRPRTRNTYETNLTKHAFPVFGERKLASVTEEDIVRVITTMRANGKSEWTIKGVLTPVGRVFAVAVRRGIVPSNPVSRLDKTERPKPGKRIRILSRDEIGRLIEAATTGLRPVFATAIFTGLRQGELLGLRWADVEFDQGVIHVMRSLDRDGEAAPLKTEAAKRDVVMMPSLAKLLAAHKLASRHSAPNDPVFASATGRVLNWRNLGGSPPKGKSAGRGLGAALAKGGIPGEGKHKVRFHDLRHTFASLLIAQGADIVFVSRQMGHANPAITLSVYAHLFDGARHADRTRDALEAGFGLVLAR